MRVQCECGKFKAEILTFPDNTPGRCVCYCDDCQTYLHSIGRDDLMDAAGGAEIIPVYPENFKIVEGADQLKCTRLSPKGLYRWWTGCCRTPVGNMMAGFPWIGMSDLIFNSKDRSTLERSLGPIKSRINGKFARGERPDGTSEKTGFKDLVVILPFVLKGLFQKKSKNSPFFKEDGKTPVVEPEVMSLETRNRHRKELGFKPI